MVQLNGRYECLRQVRHSGRAFSHRGFTKKPRFRLKSSTLYHE